MRPSREDESEGARSAEDGGTCGFYTGNCHETVERVEMGFFRDSDDSEEEDTEGGSLTVSEAAESEDSTTGDQQEESGEDTTADDDPFSEVSGDAASEPGTAGKASAGVELEVRDLPDEVRSDRVISLGQHPLPDEILAEISENELLPLSSGDPDIETLLNDVQRYIDAWYYDPDGDYPVDISQDLRLSEGYNAFYDLLAAEFTTQNLRRPLKLLDGRLFAIVGADALAEITRVLNMTADQAKAVQLAHHYYAREEGLEHDVPHINVLCIATPQNALHEIHERFDIPEEEVDLSGSIYEAEIS